MFLPPCYIESRATNSCCTLVSGEQCEAPTAKCPASVFLAVEWRKETTRKLYSASLRTLSFGKQSHAFHIGSWAWRGRTGAYKKRWGLTSEFPWPIMERLWDQPPEHQRDTTELDIVEPTFLFTSREVGMGKFIFLNYTNMHFFFSPNCSYEKWIEYRTVSVIHPWNNWVDSLWKLLFLSFSCMKVKGHGLLQIGSWTHCSECELWGLEEEQNAWTQSLHSSASVCPIISVCSNSTREGFSSVRIMRRPPPADALLTTPY